ncbi:alpha/beta hydrolase [Streptomyces acidiscabies]|uniref:Alpha/beta hydrolase n=1 Tax=Streptomyces acidiscabies TaxID=42234 RepID=A0AAP6B9N5_9ACTN|nr:alpha/beta hydrolase [Streptomyces acidiscabies]MBP5937073.1 alpha/beta hydrolase [Streptomyces sp. LBUM 1476]MBZ3914881.1 alpha/beta fold hydrolase [Streptomyces acidiscabies]MDX2960669.1 alpha/beta hydrolase [Streptomyces acidiscabies]MDX3020797.1 alpha/beta hydrolase [Streptomyces acidiscabies]MDX3792833.1 alpha/beta hydrolase [Streptomyces acidiscabies]
MARIVRWAALGAVVALVVAGCGSGSKEKADDGGKAPASDAPPASGLPTRLTGQKLDWRRCTGSSAPGGAWQCATMKAPLDWSKPKGRMIDVALVRTKSSGSADERIGSLLFNFGGPGGSGVDSLPSFAPDYTALRERYDLVSFDPRGVGRSEGVRCRDDKEIAAAETVDATPDTPAEERAFFQDADSFGQGCEKAAGELMAHVSTTDTARDMDLMRQVLGDAKTYYFGVSYGTELGGVYAHLFPKNVGRLVLDAVVDPAADAVGHARNQAQGFQLALDNYLKSTGQDPEEGTRKIADLLERLDANPLSASSGRRLTQTLAVTGIVTPLYSESAWPSLTRALEKAQDGDGSGLLVLADAYNERDSSGRYGTSSHSQRVISCLDDKQRPTADETRKVLPEFERISPVFGPYLAWDSAGWCHDWPVAGQYETPEVSAAGAAPILLVGNTGDPATPYEGARKMADELGEKVGVLLTWKGEGHGAYGSGSDCVDSTVDAYLLDGTVPRDGKVCS